MRKKYGKLRKKGNLIVFPGTAEKLIREGMQYVEQQQFEQAVHSFEEAMQFEPESDEFLLPYAIALYEIKAFQRAKEITAMLLNRGPEDYIGTMELYLTILIHLEEYEDVEMKIDILLEEGFVPQGMLSKFKYLRDLNKRLALRYGNEEPIGADAPFTLEEFLAMDGLGQQQLLASLDGTDLHAIIEVLEDIVESSELSPIVVTFALTLLHQAQYSRQVTVRKFGFEKEVIPATMALPGQDKRTQAVLAELEKLLIQDPSRLELAYGLVEKFMIIAYPFDWGSYSKEEIANAYIEYIDSLFSGEELPNTPLLAFIKQLDNDSDFKPV
ncbi:tetratricopeptide repeat protein [Sporosarcina pasteurii]|uniref:Uncharacterized protein n=1 Tax=Sporosarcina pasteurii TaxID=1474 RepID=A0A380BXW7_SPOPA|nr:tetratricopeptide repeat protein [Sporosarcina pasteurii]MDS9471367.1 tetratricopeptide repeat protein [Sporosarcina pasteurii]QBQ05005.1 tetratricopeptide repeat protein [Sporosarcina pasteurii]SUJ08104.1 Uncharacterised protein [Sporosarcina pasteurii]